MNPARLLNFLSYFSTVSLCPLQDSHWEGGGGVAKKGESNIGDNVKRNIVEKKWLQ